MARYAIGDVQGCYDELRALVERIGFAVDRDQLWFVGDLVNRGPKSLEVLRYARALGDNAIVVLGNHDLHLLALAYGSARKRKSGDTVDAVLEAKDRDTLLEWLMGRPLAHFDSERRDLMVHAGVIPQWSVRDALALSGEVAEAIRIDARQVFDEMYGNKPECWSSGLTGGERLRFSINALTRMRVCTAEGCIDMEMKGKPEEARAPFRAWFAHESRRTADVRVIFGHWSAAGYINTGKLIGLDTGCAWGNLLTAVNLDADEPPTSVTCTAQKKLPYPNRVSDN
jgi:bis(5'-nucleosyl)-tetraphosphatase (symmetrical)